MVILFVGEEHSLSRTALMSWAEAVRLVSGMEMQIASKYVVTLSIVNEGKVRIIREVERVKVMILRVGRLYP